MFLQLVPLVFVLFLAAGAVPLADCTPANCKLLLANPSQNNFSPNTASIGPGDRICFDTSIVYTKGFVFVNLTGAPGNPVVLTQCGPNAARLIMDNTQHAIIISGGLNIKISGFTGAADEYGIQISQSSFGIKIGDGASDVEVEFVEISNNFGHACLSSKSDPRDPNNTAVTFPQYFRPTFVMKNL